MNDRRPFSLLHIRELGHGTHDLPEFDTNSFRTFAFGLDRHENRLPIDRSAETLLLVVEGSLTVVWREATRAPTELGEGDTALTNPPAVDVLLAGPAGASFLAMVSRRIAANKPPTQGGKDVQDSPDHRH
jgi:hypothetical protein